MNDQSQVQFIVANSDRLNNLQIKNSKTKIKRNDITIAGTSLYNSLPVRLKSIGILLNFKLDIKQFLHTKKEKLLTARQFIERTKIL